MTVLKLSQQASVPLYKWTEVKWSGKQHFAEHCRSVNCFVRPAGWCSALVSSDNLCKQWKKTLKHSDVQRWRRRTVTDMTQRTNLWLPLTMARQKLTSVQGSVIELNWYQEVKRSHLCVLHCWRKVRQSWALLAHFCEYVFSSFFMTPRPVSVRWCRCLLSDYRCQLKKDREREREREETDQTDMLTEVWLFSVYSLRCLASCRRLADGKCRCFAVLSSALS